MPIPLIPGAEGALLDALSLNSLTALRATSKELQQHFQQHTHSLTLKRRQDVVVLLKNVWPQLTHLDLSQACMDSHHLCMLAKAQAKALPALQSLNLSSRTINLIKSHRLFPASVQQLARGSWASLTNLNLDHALDRVLINSNTLEASCYYLAAGSWPQLTSLDLSNNGFTAAAMQELGKGQWPALQSLSLRDMFQRHGSDVIRELANGPWTALQHLNLNYTRLGSESAEYLQLGNWPHLTSLSLQGCFSEPVHDWCTTPSEDTSVAEDPDSAGESASQSDSHSEAPSTGSLESLYEDPAQAAVRQAWQEDMIIACRHIAMGRWPQLAALNFAENTLSAESMAELGKGDWPGLKSVNMWRTTGQFWEQLAAAPWRMLQELDLGGGWQMHGFPHLLNADWPCLTALVLPGLQEDDRTGDTVSRARRLAKQQWPLQKLRLLMYHTLEVQFTDWHALKWLDIFKGELTPEQVGSLLQAYGQQLDTLYVTCRVAKATTVQPKPESWPQNTFLCLLSDLETAALQSLSFGHWPALEVAIPKYSPTSIRTQPQLMAVMAELLNVDLTRVDRLDLSSFVADKDFPNHDAVPIAALTDLPRAFQVLSAGQWPALRTLDLSDNALTDEVVLPLTAGVWPLLEELNLSGNQLQLAGSHELVHAKWPLLARLNLYRNAFNGQGVEFPRTDRVNLVRCLKSIWPSILVHLGQSDPEVVFHGWAGIPSVQATLCRTSLTPTCAIDGSLREFNHTVRSRFSNSTTVEW